MRRTLSVGAAMLVGGLMAVGPAGAQGGRHGRASAHIPPGQRPPAGLCRVWIDGVPPGHQPGVTDCAYAYSHVPPNGRVIYGGRATQRSYVRNRQYAPYYYGAPYAYPYAPVYYRPYYAPAPFLGVGFGFGPRHYW